VNPKIECSFIKKVIVIKISGDIWNTPVNMKIIFLHNISKRQKNYDFFNLYEIIIIFRSDVKCSCSWNLMYVVCYFWEDKAETKKLIMDRKVIELLRIRHVDFNATSRAP